MVEISTKLGKNLKRIRTATVFGEIKNGKYFIDNLTAENGNTRIWRK